MVDGQVVVVTGAAGTIGAPVCAAIAEAGGVPIVTDIDIHSAEGVAEGIRHSGFLASAAFLDITDPDATDALIADIRQLYGHVDAVINNAYPRSPNYGRPLEDVGFGDFCESLTLHLGGYFNVSQRFGIAFREQGHGSILNIASIYGLFAPDFGLYAGTGMTMPVEYAAAKAGIVNLTRYFAEYYKPYGVRCNALAPGGLRAQQPQAFVDRYAARCGPRGLLEPQDLTGSVLFLLSDASQAITGQIIVVDDGWSL